MYRTKKERKKKKKKNGISKKESRHKNGTIVDTNYGGVRKVFALKKRAACV